jgi:hypothetical protein
MPPGSILDLSPIRVSVPPDHRVVRALCAGSLDRAVSFATRRLNHARLRPFVERSFGSRSQGKVLAAALAIPLQIGEATRLALRLTKPTLATAATDPESGTNHDA